MSINRSSSPRAFQEKESLVRYASGLLFQEAKPYLKNAIIVVDARSAKDFRSQLAKYLKERIKTDGGRDLVKKVKTSRSHGNDLIQLADMVSGAVWRSFKDGDDSYRRLVSHRKTKVEVWPK